jgi:hypothetical protein
MGVIEKLWVDNYAANIQLGNFNRTNVRSIKSLVDSNTTFKKPVALIAAGPSLDKNINQLKEHQDKFIILCADVILYRLISEGITPDFVCSIDPNPSIMRLWGDIDTQGLKLIAPTTVSPSVLDMWKGDIWLFNQHDVSSKDKHALLEQLVKPTQSYGFITNMFFVGATLLQVSTIFKPNQVCLMGYDFSFPDDKTHCNGVLTSDISEPLHKKEIKSDGEINGLRTSNLLMLYKNTFLRLCADVTARGEAVIVNCTEGGILMEVPQSSLTSIAITTTDIKCKHLLGGPRRRKRKK